MSTFVSTLKTSFLWALAVTPVTIIFGMPLTNPHTSPFYAFGELGIFGVVLAYVAALGYLTVGTIADRAHWPGGLAVVLSVVAQFAWVLFWVVFFRSIRHWRFPDT